MKREQQLLRLLGVKYYTYRHLFIIKDFLATGEKDVKILLNQLGNWNDDDLKIAQEWMGN